MRAWIFLFLLAVHSCHSFGFLDPVQIDPFRWADVRSVRYIWANQTWVITVRHPPLTAPYFPTPGNTLLPLQANPCLMTSACCLHEFFRLYTSVQLYDSLPRVSPNCTVPSDMFDSSAWTGALTGFPGTSIVDVDGIASISIPNSVFLSVLGSLGGGTSRVITSFVGVLYLDPNAGTLTATQSAIVLTIPDPTLILIGINTKPSCTLTPQGRCLLCSNTAPNGSFFVYTPKGEETSVCDIACSMGYYYLADYGSCARCPASEPACLVGQYATNCTPTRKPQCAPCTGSPLHSSYVYRCDWECFTGYLRQGSICTRNGTGTPSGSAGSMHVPKWDDMVWMGVGSTICTVAVLWYHWSLLRS